MAFEYVPTGRNTTPGLQYGSMGQGQQQQQQGQSSFNPMQLYNMYQQFAGGSAAGGAAGGGASSGLLGLGGGSAGLGGSGLIGSSTGAISAGSTGGASFGLGGSLVGGSGAIGGSTFAGGAGASALGGAGAGAAGGGAAAGGAGAAAGGAAGGGIAAAGPWAALAAAIILNEKDSRKKGLRSENKGEYTRDLLSGKVLTQDIDGKWGPMEDKWTGGKASKWGLVGDQKGASQIMSFRIGPGLKSIWNDGTIGKIRKLF